MVFPALYPPWFRGSTFLLSNILSKLPGHNQFHQLSRGVLLCEDTVSVQLSMVLYRFGNWLDLTMWPIFGNLSCCEAFFVQSCCEAFFVQSCCEAFFVQSEELALVIYWQVLNVWVFDLVRTRCCILAQSWVGQIHQHRQATGLGETTLTTTNQSFEVERYEPSWQTVNRVPTHLSIIWPCIWLSISVGSSLWIAARLGRRRAPSLKGVHLIIITDCDSGSPVARGGQQSVWWPKTQTGTLECWMSSSEENRAS